MKVLSEMQKVVLHAVNIESNRFSDAGYIIVAAVIAAVIIITILTIRGNKDR